MDSLDEKVARYEALRAQNRHLGRPRTGRQKARVYREGIRGGRVKCPGLPVVLVWPDRAGDVHQMRFADEERAYAQLAELRAAGMVGQRARAAYTFAEYVPVFLGERRGADIKTSTLREDLRRLMRDLVPVFGSFPLDEIDAGAVLEYRSRVLATRTAATWNRLRALLSAVFSSALRRGFIKKHPIKGFIPASHEEQPDLRDVVFSEPEQAALLRACAELDEELEHPFILDLVLIGFDTAARPGGEICRLRWRDVDFENDAITFYGTKSGHDRTVEMTPRLRAALWARYHARRSEVYVFPGRGSTRARVNYKDVWRAAIERAGLRYRKPYAMRHTAITNLARGRMTVADLREWAGHSSVVVTQRYLHAGRAVGAKARAILGAVGEPAEETFSRTLARKRDRAKSG